MQHVPTQDRIRTIIKSYLSFPAKGTTCFDPCCGEGDAILEICGDNNFLFGMELHSGRALQAKEKPFVQVLAGPFENCIISNRVFGFSLVNPPYDWMAGGKMRYEEVFMGRMNNYMVQRGVSCFIVPTSLFEYRGQDVLKMIYGNYNDVRILKYPEPEFQQFRQIVIFGVKKPAEKVTASNEWWAEEVAKITTGDLPLLELQAEPLYEVPYINPGFIKTFRVNHYDEVLAKHESQTLDFLEKLKPKATVKNLTAPYYLDKAQLALLAVGGYIDGKMPGHYLSGRYENAEIATTELDVDSGEETYTIRKTSSSVFYILTKDPDETGSRLREIR
ncbi:MAG: hypothetical protein GX958_10575 [Desulfitobacterium sp.]|nr:hypothetical protein [Desulfitobacterium sp.]